MGDGTSEGSIFTIFGATGDLARRKLLPALYRNHASGKLDPRVRILGVSRTDLDDDAFRERAREALSVIGAKGEELEAFLQRLHYMSSPEGDAEDFARLAQKLQDLRALNHIPENYVFYLSLPPRVFGRTIAGLGATGLNVTNAKGWTRVVVEKPFGTDLESARLLNAEIHEHFDEDQIYRIDHYLGKETVQNLLVFRLANAFIESSWNRERVEEVQITVGESLGVGTRAGYYDQSGALRDMLQNHITQLVSLVAMEVPTSFSARSIRYEKLKVLKSIHTIDPADVVRGQYTAGMVDGHKVKGYLEEDDVPASSDTETFVAVKMGIDSWRWQGVPFYIRTGKRMPKKTSQIAVRFRGAPVRYFERLGCPQDTADVLTITLQPNEGFSFHFDIKVPGNPLRLERVPLRFQYDDHFHGTIPEAYETLLLDVISGDQTLFVHGDEVEESWRVYEPLLKSPPKVRPYAAGTWGPPEADDIAIPETDLWQGTDD